LEVAVNAAAYPTDFAMPRRRRMSREALAAVGLSLAVHVGVIGYIATEKFKEIIPPYTDPGPVQIEAVPPDKPPPPPPSDQHQPAKAVAFHVPDSVIPPLAKVEPIPTEIVPPSQNPEPPQVIAQIPQPPVQVADLRAPPAPARDRVIRNPTWLRKPSASEMERIYPRRAADLEKSGGATLMCTVASSGSVRDCSVIDESPKGLGFGEAALAGAKLFKLSPRTVDGEAVEGAKVRIPLVFSLAG
jgi:protein TonB